jgi:nucleoside-diphosphate-sugar epimerase
VHGHIENPPADENYRAKPDDVYQATKLEGEMRAREAIGRGEPVTIVRPGPIYGEGDTRFLKLFKAIQKGRFVMIGSGEVRLHMVHVDDLVRGIMLCGSKAEALGEIFIITGPDAPTLNQLVAEAAASMHVAPPRLKIPVAPVYAAGWMCEMMCVPLRINPPLHRRRVGFFTHHREFDIGKARRLLGYTPRVTLEEGVRRTALWYSEQGLIESISDFAGAA